MTATRLYLHVGTHKTGTTSFQQFCMDNADRLAAHGIGFFAGRRPRAKGGPVAMGNGWWLADSFLRPDLLTVMRLKSLQGRIPDIVAKNHERLRFHRFAAAAQTPALLVSAEAFSFIRTRAEIADLRRFFTRLGLEIIPLLTLRESASWCASHCAQLDKMNYQGPLVDARASAERVNADWVYDHAAIRAVWSGLGPLHEISYETAMAQHGSTLPPLLRAIGLPNKPGASDSYFLNRRKAATG